MGILGRVINFVLERLPLALGVFFAVFGVVTVPSVIAGVLGLGVIIIGLISALLCFFVVYFAVGRIMQGNGQLFVESNKRESILFGVLTLLLLVVWCAGNIHYSFHTAMINRDPGVYAVTAVWLQSNPTTNVTVDGGLAEGIVDASAVSSGMWQKEGDSNTIQPQGAHLLPTILASTGILFGQNAIFYTNTVIMGCALWVFYALVRLFTKPRWAALGTVVMMCALPIIYFSRDTYTEPLAMLVTLSSVLIIGFMIKYIDTIKTKRLVAVCMWAAAGLLLGTGILARPDGFFAMITVILSIITVIILNYRNTVVRVYHVLIFLFFCAVPASIAVVDLNVLTTEYLTSQGPMVERMFIAACIVSIILLLFVALPKLRHRIGDFFIKNKKIITTIVASTIVATAIFLIARPLFMIGELSSPDTQSTAGAVMQIQANLGDPIKPRSYYEYTISWITWYIGGIIVLLAFSGVLYSVKKSFYDNKPLYILILTLTVLTTVIYLWNPVITPDQVWASRRFIPVIFPGLVIMSMIALDALYSFVLRQSKNKMFVNLAFVAASLLIVIQPLITTRPFVRIEETNGQAGAIEKLCNVLPKNALVIWVHGDILERKLVQSTRAYCGVQSLGVDSVDIKTSGNLQTQKLQIISKRAEKKSLTTYIAIEGSDASSIAPDVRDEFTVVGMYGGQSIKRTLDGPPISTVTSFDSIELAKMKDGKLENINQ